MQLEFVCSFLYLSCLPKFNFIQDYLSPHLINSFPVIRNLSAIISRSNVTDTSSDKKWLRWIEFWHILLYHFPQKEQFWEAPGFDSVIDTVLGLRMVSSLLYSDNFSAGTPVFPCQFTWFVVPRKSEALLFSLVWWLL